MSDAAVYLLLPDGMADWEPGYAIAGLHHWAKVPVRTVGFTRASITTMGGLRLLPDITLAELPAGAEQCVSSSYQAVTFGRATIHRARSNRS